MSNSEPSAIVLQGIFCIRALYEFRFNGEIGSFNCRRDRSTLLLDRITMQRPGRGNPLSQSPFTT